VKMAEETARLAREAAALAEARPPRRPRPLPLRRAARGLGGAAPGGALN